MEWHIDYNKVAYMQLNPKRNPNMKTLDTNKTVIKPEHLINEA